MLIASSTWNSHVIIIYPRHPPSTRRAARPRNGPCESCIVVWTRCSPANPVHRHRGSSDCEGRVEAEDMEQPVRYCSTMCGRGTLLRGIPEGTRCAHVITALGTFSIYLPLHQLKKVQLAPSIASSYDCIASSFSSLDFALLGRQAVKEERFFLSCQQESNLQTDHEQD